MTSPGETPSSCEKLTGHLFPLGRTVMTPGIRELALKGLNFGPILERHANGDWGDLSKTISPTTTPLSTTATRESSVPTTPT